MLNTYDFCFDEMVYEDYLFLVSYAIRVTNKCAYDSDPLNCITLSQKYTNTDVAKLPVIELNNYLMQFLTALVPFFQELTDKYQEGK